MNLSKLFYSLVFLCLGFAFAATSAMAQTEETKRSEPNYQITLHVLIGSNDAAARNDLPANLANVSSQLRSTFAFSNFRVANTFLGRIGNNGNFEYKSTADLQGKESSEDTMTFLEWSLGSFRSVPNGFQAQSFRFGARIPVRTTMALGDTGKTVQNIAYESIGLNFARIGIPENTPTLLGTLSLPKTSGTLFLVMTVTPADR
jgi:hypothetical protein